MLLLATAALSAAAWLLLAAPDRSQQLSSDSLFPRFEPTGKRDAVFPPELFDDMLTIVEEEVSAGGATFDKKRAMTRRASELKATSAKATSGRVLADPPALGATPPNPGMAVV